MSAPNPFKDCTSVSPECPVQSSIYGYYPSPPGNAFLLAWFGTFILTNTVLGIRYKTWTYLIAMTLGCICEAIGYSGRLILSSNPYSMSAFAIQEVCLIIAPVFFAAAIYLTLKHLTICFGAQHSVLKPSLYTWIFISCDILSLLLQGAGAAIAATADSDKTQKSGNDLAFSGIIFQVATLLCFGVLAFLYYIRQHAERQNRTKEAEITKEKSTFKMYLAGLFAAYLCIVIRCCYRIAEMSGGWRSSIMINEIDLMVLDGAMIGLAVLCLSVFHPGCCFPRLDGRQKYDHKRLEFYTS